MIIANRSEFSSSCCWVFRSCSGVLLVWSAAFWNMVFQRGHYSVLFSFVNISHMNNNPEAYLGAEAQQPILSQEPVSWHELLVYLVTGSIAL